MIDELENEILETRAIVSKFISNEQKHTEESNNKLKEEISTLQSRLEEHDNELSKNKLFFYFLKKIFLIKKPL